MFTDISIDDYYQIWISVFDWDNVVESVHSLIKEDPTKDKLVLCCGGDGLLTLMDNLDNIVTELKKTTHIKEMALSIGSMCVENTVELYNECVRERGWPDLKLIIDNGWEVASGSQISHMPLQYNKFDSTPRVKNKLALLFTGYSRPDRGFMLASFIKNNLLERSYVSAYHDAEEYNDIWVTRTGDKATVSDTGLSDEDLEVLNNNKHLFPMTLTRTKFGTNECNCYHPLDDIDLYNDSYFSLILETMFYKESFLGSGHISTLYLSEKTYKTIAAKHPFIIAQRPGVLAAFRELGYKSFSPYIDETYDTIENDVDRLHAINNEVLRLSKYTDDQWLEFQHGVKDIVEHNFNLLSTRKQIRYRVKQNTEL